MRRLPWVLVLGFCLVAGSAAQFFPRREDPETDPKAFQITTRADLEDAIKRIRRQGELLKQAANDKEKTQLRQGILRLCQDELSRPENASGVLVMERTPHDAPAPDVAIRWQGAYAALEEQIRTLGPDGLAEYERLYGPRAEALLAQAVAAGDRMAIQSLNRRFGLTRAGVRASILLATLFWEEGRLSPAARGIERALAVPELLSVPQRVQLSAWLASCYRTLGERANLATLVEAAAPLAGEAADEGGTSRPLGELLKRMLAEARDNTTATIDALGVEWPGGNYTNTALPALPSDYSQIAWARTLPRLGAVTAPPFMDYPPSMVPPYLPVFDGTSAYVNTGDSLVSYDLIGGAADAPAWVCRPFPVFSHNWRVTEPDHAMILPVSVHQGVAFAALENPLTSHLHDREPDPNFGLFSHYPQVRRGLCAVDCATGRLLWKVGGLYQGDEHDTTSFLSAVVHEGTLYAMGTRMPNLAEIFLYALDPATGAVRWHMRLCYGQQEISMFGRPARQPYASLPAIAGGTLYVCTNIGGVVAVNLTQRCLTWISRYEYLPRPITKYTVTYYRDVTWYNSPTIYVEHLGKPYVVVAPTDSDRLFCMDARTGSILWRVAAVENPILGGRAVAGVRNGLLYVADDGGRNGGASARLHVIDLPTGRVQNTLRVTPFNRGNTLSLAGRPCLAGNRLLWPGQNERECAIAEIDLDALKVVSSAYVPPSYMGWGFSVFAQHAVVFTITGNDYTRGNSQLAMRFNPAALLEAARKDAAAAPQDPEPLLRLGLLTLRLGDRSEGVKHLRAAHKLASAPTLNTPLRDRAAGALVATYLGQADAAFAGRRYQETLGHVQSAREFARERTQLTECFLREERVLQAQGQAVALEEFYRRLVESDPAFGVGADPEIPAALYARLRLASLVGNRDAVQAASLWQEVLEAPDRLAYNGTPLRALAMDSLRALLRQAGRAPYEPQDKAAAVLLEKGEPEGLRQLLRRFPLATAADEAVLRLAQLELDQREPARAAILLQSALDEWPERDRRLELQALQAMSYYRAGEKLRARLLAARILRASPQGDFPLDGVRVSYKDALTPLTTGGAADAAEGLPRLPTQLEQLWANPGANQFARLPRQPAAGLQGRVLVAARTEAGTELQCLDCASRELAWRQESEVTLYQAFATPAGLLCVAPQGLAMYSDTGDELWRVSTMVLSGQYCLFGGMLTHWAPFTDRGADRNRVSVAARDAQSGGELWRAVLEAATIQWIGQGDCGVYVLAQDSEPRLYLLDAESGALLAQRTVRVQGRVAATPQVAGDRVYVVDQQGEVQVFAASSLEPRVSLRSGQRYPSLFRAEPAGLVVLGIYGVTVLNPDTGAVVWQRQNEQGEVLQQRDVQGENLVLHLRTPAGTQRILVLKTSDGTQVLRHDPPAPAGGERYDLYSAGVFEGGVAAAYAVFRIQEGVTRLAGFRVLVLNNDGTERMRWDLDAPRGAPQVQLVVQEGYVVVICNEWTTYCFGRKN